MKSSPHDVKRMLRLSVAVCLVLDLLLAGYLLSPWSPSKAAGEHHLTRLTGQYHALAERVDALERLQDRIHISQKQIQDLARTSMPHQRDASSVVLTEIRRLADSSHVQAQGMHFKTAAKAHEGLREVDIQIAVTGDYQNVVQFLNQVERSPIFFLIDGISVSAGGEQNGSGSGNSPNPAGVRLLVSLETWVQAAPSTAQGGTTA